MNAALSELIAGVESNSAEARAKFGALNKEQLNWKPSTESWSVGQCLDHLIKGDEGLLEKIEPILEGRHKTTFFERLPFLPKFFGGFLLKAVAPENPKKMKNPRSSIRSKAILRPMWSKNIWISKRKPQR